MVRKAFIAVALLATLTASAQQKSKSMMISAARQTLATHYGEDSYRNANLRVADNIDQLAVVTSAEGGTVFVNMQTGTVVGCSPSKYSSQDSLPCGLRMWIDAANHAIKSNNLGWTRASDYNITEKVNSFVTTRWSQNNPYNLYCPVDSKEKTSLTGCVATAMAQIMKYYEYPTKGTGTGSYSLNSSKTYTTAAISGTYDWSNMKTTYTSGYSASEAKAVATLMRDCGYSVKMQYSSDGSAASDTYIPSALVYNFSYDSLAVNYLARDFTADDEWYSTIYTELIAKRPVIFSGQSEDKGGHCFVLDGVDTDGKVHVNWGWGGQQDGFYDMDVFKEGFDFINFQAIVYGFNPQPTATTSTPKYHTCIIVDEPKLTADGTDLLLDAGVWNYDWRVFRGDLYLNIVDTSNSDKSYTYKLMSASNKRSVLRSYWGWSFDNETLNSHFRNRANASFVFPAATYEVSFVYKGIYDDAEKTAVTEGGIEWKQKFTADTNGVITIGESTGITSPTINRTSTIEESQAYDLNGNRVSNSYKGLKIVKGRKYIER